MDTPTSQASSPSRRPTAPVLWAVLFIVVIGVAGAVWYLARQGSGSEPTNANAAVTNGNTSSANSNGSISTAGWKQYADQDVTFKYPQNWSATRAEVVGGSFAATSLRSIVIAPSTNQLDFSPAARCTVQVFASNGKSLDAWIAASGLYAETGLSIRAQKPLQVGSLVGVDVTEGGENAQVTRSYFFASQDEQTIVRFGYYLDVDAQPRATFEEVKTTCDGILGTLTSA